MPHANPFKFYKNLSSCFIALNYIIIGFEVTMKSVQQKSNRNDKKKEKYNYLSYKNVGKSCILIFNMVL